jgi:primosomal protein N'
MGTLEKLKSYGFRDEILERFQAKSRETGIPIDTVIIRCFAIWIGLQDYKNATISNQSLVLQKLIEHNYKLKSDSKSLSAQNKTQFQTINQLKKQNKIIKKNNSSLQKSNNYLKEQLEELKEKLLSFEQSELLTFGKNIRDALLSKDRSILNQKGLDLKEVTLEAVNIAEEGFAELEDEIERLSKELIVAQKFMEVVRDKSPTQFGKWMQMTRTLSRG